MTPHVESTDLDPLMQGEAVEGPMPLSPQARVDASRAALQLWILRTYHPERLEPDPPADDTPPGEASDQADPAWLAALVDSLTDLPVASVATRYLRRWWTRHPLRATMQLAGATSRDLLHPAATKHPWLLLGGALATGALLAHARPWRWVSGSTLLASLVPPFSLASILTSVTAMVHPSPPDIEPGHDDPAFARQAQHQQQAATAPQASATVEAAEPA